jgi:hypothetical protein
MLAFVNRKIKGIGADEFPAISTFTDETRRAIQRDRG